MAISYVHVDPGGALSGGNATLTFSSVQANDVIIVGYCVGSAVTLDVTSSSTSTHYSQIVDTFVSGDLRYGVFRRVVPSEETNAICTGGGDPLDGVAAIGYVFRNVDTGTPEDVAPTTATGISAQPDSPSITVVSCSAAIISLIGLTANTGLTQPSSFINPGAVIAPDTRIATCAGAWISNVSTSPFDPTPWTAGASTTWCAVTVALRPASDPGNALLLVGSASPIVLVNTIMTGY